MAGEEKKQSDNRPILMTGIYFFCRRHANTCKKSLVVLVLLSFVVLIRFENSFNKPLYKSQQTPSKSQLRRTKGNRLEISNERWSNHGVDNRNSQRSKKRSVINFFGRRINHHIRHLPPHELHRIRSPSDKIYRNPSSNASYTEKRNFSELPKEMKLLRPMLFKDAPRKYLLDFKNPCYYGKYGNLECLPYFFLLGNPKCGTTDIWSKINAHPEIGNSGKEPHWWARGSLNYRSYPLSLYERTYTSRAIVALLQHKRANKSAAITGDGSASTFWDNQMWQSFYPESRKVGPPYVTADVIHAILPNAKLLVSFRDPTTRKTPWVQHYREMTVEQTTENLIRKLLYSGYVYFNLKRKKTVSTEVFHDKVISELESFQNCTSNRSVRACAYSTAEEKVRIRVGLYSIYTKDWLERFPPSQFMFLKLEDWGSKCTEMLPQIYRFLEVSTLTTSRIQEICAWKTRNANAKKLQAIGPMLNQTRKLLRNFYRPYVKELAKLLNDTRFLWDYLED